MISKIKALIQHEGFMKYFKNTSWLFGEKILRMVMGLLVGIWVTRYLGPEKFGLLSYAQSFVGLFTIVSTLGLDGIVIRELVKDETKKNELLGTSFCLKLIGSFGVFIILAIAINFTSNDTYTNMLVFIIASATTFQSFNVIDFYFQSKVLSKYIVYSNIMSLLLSSIVKIILILSKAPLEAFAIVVVFDSFILALGFIYFYNSKKSSFMFWRFKKEIAYVLLKESWPLIFVSAIVALNMRIDQVFLGNMLDKTVVGLYSSAIRVSELWYILPAVISSSIYPSIILAKKNNEILYKKRIIMSIKYMSIFTIPIALIVSFFSTEIVHLLYGEEFLLADKYLTISIWIGVPYLIFFITNQMIYTEKLTRSIFYLSLVTVFLNITLNLILIPIYGGIGAMVATLIATYISTAISILFINYKTGIFWKLI